MRFGIGGEIAAELAKKLNCPQAMHDECIAP
jgi:hypothetical protein